MSGWVKLENTMPEDPKLPGLSDRAFRLWIHALCYCSRGETDGRVPKALMTSLSVTGSAAAVKELLATKPEPMLIDCGDEYEVRNYLKFNLSKAEISEMREKGRERAAKLRQRRREREESAQSNAVTTSVTTQEHRSTHASGSGVVEESIQGQGRLTREIVDQAIIVLSGRWTTVEEIAIENAAAMYPEVDLLQAARLAVTWAASPSWEIDAAGATLRAALRKLDSEKPADGEQSEEDRRLEWLKA